MFLSNIQGFGTNQPGIAPNRVGVIGDNLYRNSLVQSGGFCLGVGMDIGTRQLTRSAIAQPDLPVLRFTWFLTAERWFLPGNGDGYCDSVTHALGYRAARFTGFAIYFVPHSRAVAFAWEWGWILGLGNSRARLSRSPIYRF